MQKKNFVVVILMIYSLNSSQNYLFDDNINDNNIKFE